MGELRAAIEAGVMTASGVPELGDVVLGSTTGRASEDAVTICDLTGTGAQDTAIATEAVARAAAAGVGSVIRA
jgi:ornithine cyclodeaminase